MVKSMKPGKQRKAHFNAPMHQKRKRVAARLQIAKPDEQQSREALGHAPKLALATKNHDLGHSPNSWRSYARALHAGHPRDSRRASFGENGP